MDEVFVLVCGTPGFTAAMAGPKLVEPGQRPQQGELKGLLKELGFNAEQVHTITTISALVLMSLSTVLLHRVVCQPPGVQILIKTQTNTHVKRKLFHAAP